MIITEIREGKRGNSLLFSEGTYIISLKTEVVLKNDIKVGTCIDAEYLNEIKKQTDLCKAKEKALNLLSYRSRSKKELKDRISKIVDDDSADEAVKKMEDIGLVNDESFATQYANELLFFKKFSLSRTKYKLIEKGISGEIIEEVLSRIEVDEEEQVLSLLNGKFRNKITDEKGKNRVIGALSRLGYSWGVIKRAFFIFNEGIAEDELI